MAKVHKGSEPCGCDICAAINAPFGYQPPGGARNLKPGQRPLRACINPDCRAQCDARLSSANSAARTTARTPDPNPNQADLF